MLSYTDPRPCLLCHKPIQPDDNYLWENDAVVFTCSAGYGSRHDMTMFSFVICDDCIDSRISAGTILRVNPRRPKELDQYAYEEAREEEGRQSASPPQETP
jgi:hypothetical protein